MNWRPFSETASARPEAGSIVPRFGRALLSLLVLCAGCQRGEQASARERAEPERTPRGEGPATRELAVGAEVVLGRDGELGVPLHEAPSASGSYVRIPSGTAATVLELGSGSWIRVRTVDGLEGWVVRRYLTSGGKGGATTGRERSALSSEALLDFAPTKEACLKRWQARPPRKKNTAPRLGTYNVRWFPDGRPGLSPKGPGTDVEWLACVIASEDVDAVALQEWKHSPRAEEKGAELTAELARLTGESHRILLDDCPNESGQHVGVLWNEARVAVKKSETIGALNPKEGACSGGLRPGFLVELSTWNGRRLDFVSVHLKSGVDERSYRLRDKTFASLGAFVKERPNPLLVAGDLNTMGCEDCAPPISSAEERVRRDAKLLAEGAETLPDAPFCSHFYGKEPGLLDGFVTARLEVRPKVFVGGACSLLACRAALKEEPPGEDVLSDHCPLVLSLESH